MLFTKSDVFIQSFFYAIVINATTDPTELHRLPSSVCNKIQHSFENGTFDCRSSPTWTSRIQSCCCSLVTTNRPHVMVTAGNTTGSTLVDAENPHSWAVQHQWPVLQPLRHSHLSEEFLLVKPAHCPAPFAHRCCTGQFWKLHLTGEFINLHSEVSRAALVVAGEVEVNVYEVSPSLFECQDFLIFIKLEVAPHWCRVTIWDWIQVHGRVIQ